MGIKLHSPVLERLRKPKEPRVKTCEWSGCFVYGPHRAPHSPLETNKFRWFCKTHAAQYNKAWNFLADMTDEQVEAIVRYDTVWNRPSWPIGTGPTLDPFIRNCFADPLRSFENQKENHQTFSDPPPLGNKDAELQRALDVFGLGNTVDELRVKQRYKELVKLHHPDANGAKKASEELIKEINHASSVILKHFAS